MSLAYPDDVQHVRQVVVVAHVAIRVTEAAAWSHLLAVVTLHELLRLLVVGPRTRAHVDVTNHMAATK